jgi:hypothetical protein
MPDTPTAAPKMETVRYMRSCFSGQGLATVVGIEVQLAAQVYQQL